MTVIVDYQMGNVGSIANMLRRIGAPDVVVSGDPAVLGAADRLILPGVGAFDQGMENLSSAGLADVLTRRVCGDGVPILGICLGMQLFTRRSEEGRRPGLGWIDAETRRFRFPEGSGLKVPHMGWNYVRPVGPNALIDETAPQRFYFVHAYYVDCREEADVLATACYGAAFPCAVRRANVFGVQFHPEKSHRFGMALLKRFVEARPWS